MQYEGQSKLFESCFISDKLLLVWVAFTPKGDNSYNLLLRPSIPVTRDNMYNYSDNKDINCTIWFICNIIIPLLIRPLP